MNWLWRFSSEESNFRREVVLHKHGQNSPWSSNVVDTAYDVGVWRIIRDPWTKLFGEHQGGK